MINFRGRLAGFAAWGLVDAQHHLTSPSGHTPRLSRCVLRLCRIGLARCGVRELIGVLARATATAVRGEQGNLHPEFAVFASKGIISDADVFGLPLPDGPDDDDARAARGERTARSHRKPTVLFDHALFAFFPGAHAPSRARGSRLRNG